MEFTTNEDKDNFKPVKMVIIQIGETRYRIDETIESELCINKICFESPTISIIPRVSNEIYLK